MLGSCVFRPVHAARNRDVDFCGGGNARSRGRRAVLRGVQASGGASVGVHGYAGNAADA
jgi:hypothetical protein